jgi:hypothetical protein
MNFLIGIVGAMFRMAITPLVMFTLRAIKTAWHQHKTKKKWEQGLVDDD